MENNNLTKREWMATMILQGLIANPERYKYISKNFENGTFNHEEATKKNVHKAVLMANALIEELKQ